MEMGPLPGSLTVGWKAEWGLLLHLAPLTPISLDKHVEDIATQTEGLLFGLYAGSHAPPI